MPVNRLNLSALRSKAVTTPGKQVIPIPFGPSPGHLGVVQGPGFIGFTLNGSLRWLIDVRRFAGAPALTVQAAAPRVSRVELKGARFPGSNLTADFVLQLQPTGIFGTPASFSFTLGGFQGQVVLERWLAGQQVLQSPVTLGQDVCPLGENSKLSVSGSAEARFFPTWQFQMFGTKLAEISGLRDPLDSERFFLKLLFPGDPSISRQPKSKRTRMDLAADSHTWNLKPALTDIPIGELVADAVAFDPTPDHSAGDDTFLTARFGFRAQWLVLDGFALAVGESQKGPAFEVDTSNGEVTSFLCEPALLTVSAPLAAHLGERVATKPLPPASQSFLPVVARPGTPPGWGTVAGPAVAGKPWLSLPDFSVHLLRREDLLSLDFCSTTWRSKGAEARRARWSKKTPRNRPISWCVSTRRRTSASRPFSRPPTAAKATPLRTIRW
jgi:hypothetical protein